MAQCSLTLSPGTPSVPGGPTGPGKPGRPGVPCSPYNIITTLKTDGHLKREQ